MTIRVMAEAGACLDECKRSEKSVNGGPRNELLSDKTAIAGKASRQSFGCGLRDGLIIEDKADDMSFEDIRIPEKSGGSEPHDRSAVEKRAEGERFSDLKKCEMSIQSGPRYGKMAEGMTDPWFHLDDKTLEKSIRKGPRMEATPRGSTGFVGKISEKLSQTSLRMSKERTENGFHVDGRIPEKSVNGESRNGRTVSRMVEGGSCSDGKKCGTSSLSDGRNSDGDQSSESNRPRKSRSPCSRMEIVERLYGHHHACNHARCAANNPDYAMKAPLPPKQYLVARKHAYGGVREKVKSNSCDHDRSHVLQSLSSSAGAAPQRRKSTSSGSKHRSWNGSVAIDKKQDAWSGSVAIEKKGGERPEQNKFVSPSGAAKSGRKGDRLQCSRRSTTESSILEDRQRKPRRSSCSSQVTTVDRRRSSITSEDDPNVHCITSSSSFENGSPTVSCLTEERGNSSRVAAEGNGVEDSPAVSVGSNRTATSKEMWQQPEQQQHSPESTCVTSSSVSPFESTSSVVNSIDKEVHREGRRKSTEAIASKLTRLSSTFSSVRVSQSTKGSASSKSSRSPTPNISVTSATPPSVTSSLAKKSLSKLKDSPNAAAGSRPDSKLLARPSWNSSTVTAAPAPYSYSKPEQGAVKTAKKFIVELRDSPIARKTGSKAPATQNDLRGKGRSSTTPVSPSNSVTALAQHMTVPIPESSAEKHVDPGFPLTLASKNPHQSDSRDPPIAGPPVKLDRPASAQEKENEVGKEISLKFGKRGQTTWLETVNTNETVELKKGETAERRLSEEYMTDHMLVVSSLPKNIVGGRVRSLVSAFESLKTHVDDAEPLSNDETVRRSLPIGGLPMPPSPSPIAT